MNDVEEKWIVFSGTHQYKLASVYEMQINGRSIFRCTLHTGYTGIHCDALALHSSLTVNTLSKRHRCTQCAFNAFLFMVLTQELTELSTCQFIQILIRLAYDTKYKNRVPTIEMVSCIDETTKPFLVGTAQYPALFWCLAIVPCINKEIGHLLRRTC